MRAKTQGCCAKSIGAGGGGGGGGTRHKRKTVVEGKGIFTNKVLSP